MLLRISSAALMRNTMERAIIAASFFCIPFATTFAQQSVMGNIPGKQMDLQPSSRGVVTQLPMAPPKTNGDVYLNSNWATAEITLVQLGTVVKGYPVRLNLETNAFEIQYEEKVKVLPGVRVSHFVLITPDGDKEKYVSGDNYMFDNQPIGGFLQVLDSGAWMMLAKKELKIIEPTYNPALHVGNRDNEFVKDEKFFFSKDNVLYKTDLPTKKFCGQFVGHEVAVRQFINKEKINLKKMGGLMKMLAFLNRSI